jgi:hypothetical protein
MEDDNYAAIGCSSRTQPTDVPSQETTCHTCGADLWISDIVLETIARDHPGMELRSFCFFTCMPVTDEPVTVPEEQRVYLREHHNLSDEQIDELVALSEVMRRRE